MKDRSRIGFRRFAFLVAIGALLSSLAACDRSSNDTGQISGYAYITSADAEHRELPGAVLQYSVASDGSLAPLSVASVPAGATPIAVVSDPTGHYVYVVNQSGAANATISQYAVGAGGGLVALSPAVVSISGPSSAVVGHSASVDPTGRFLYVVIETPYTVLPAPSIAQYSIGSDG